MNHAGFEQRLSFVRDLLQNHFAVEISSIEPVEYEADCPFAYNNFIFKVGIGSHGDQPHAQQLGSTPLPLDSSFVVVRLSNTASGLPDHNRVENEVGMMLLFRQALSNHNLGHLVPAVYGWGSAEHGQGWILQEFKQGSQLDRVYDEASQELKDSILSQIPAWPMIKHLMSDSEYHAH